MTSSAIDDRQEETAGMLIARGVAPYYSGKIAQQEHRIKVLGEEKQKLQKKVELYETLAFFLLLLFLFFGWNYVTTKQQQAYLPPKPRVVPSSGVITSAPTTSTAPARARLSRY